MNPIRVKDSHPRRLNWSLQPKVHYHSSMLEPLIVINNSAGGARSVSLEEAHKRKLISIHKGQFNLGRFYGVGGPAGVAGTNGRA